MNFYKVTEHHARDADGKPVDVGAIVRVSGDLPPHLLGKCVMINITDKERRLVVNPAPKKRKKQYAGGKRVLPIHQGD